MLIVDGHLHLAMNALQGNRDLLVPASGFQSLQFRLLETQLGLKRERYEKFYIHFNRDFCRQPTTAFGKRR